MHNQSAPPTIPLSYIRVRAVVWECGDGEIDRQTAGRDQYTFRLGYASNGMKLLITSEVSLLAGLSCKYTMYVV